MLPLTGINPWSFARIKENTINQSIYDIAIAVAVRKSISFKVRTVVFSFFNGEWKGIRKRELTFRFLFFFRLKAFRGLSLRV